MKREKLSAEKRTVTGKQVRKLRKEGILPANIYGKGFESTHIQMPLVDFVEVYKKAHETGLVDLEVNGETLPVLIHHVQIHPMTYIPVHADFYKVNLKEKVKASIPIVAIGEAKAVTDKIGVLLQVLNEVEIEALPADLIENIEVNVQGLAAIDDNILLESVKLPAEVTLITDPSQMMFQIGELVSQEAEELAAEEEAAAEAASEEAVAEGEKSEGEEEKGEGEEKAEGEKSEESNEAKPEEKPTE